MPHIALRATLLAFAFVASAHAANPAAVAQPAPIQGVNALPDGQAKVSATLGIAPGRNGSPTGTRILDVSMTPLGAILPITRYDVELSKQVHLIAVSDDFRTFVHEHGDRPSADGHFRVAMPFPHGGIWHVYADGVPSGLGQQVMRFEIDLGPASPATAAKPGAPQPTGLVGMDGSYAVTFDALDLKSGQESELTMHLLRDGRPAPDVTPYLGVAAHAVFIDASTLAYIHAHATLAEKAWPAAATAGHSHTAGTAMPGMAMPGMAMPGTGGTAAAGHGAMPAMVMKPLRPGAKLSPDLTLHVRAPTAGTYLLWIQFSGGGKVRTVPFVLAVK